MKQQYRMRIISEQQLQDELNSAMSTIDDISAAAIGLSTGGQQAYTQFILLRDEFRDRTLQIKNNYQDLYL